jgi:hypothetical protein
MTPRERAGLIVGGGLLAVGSGAVLLYDSLKGSGSGAGASGQVSLQVLGYEVFGPGSAESVSTSVLLPMASVSKGDAVGAAVQVTNLTPNPLGVGVRAWVVQPGYSSGGAALVSPLVNGEVEGHLFPAANPSSSSALVGTATVPGSSLVSKGRVVLGFYSAPVTGGIAAPTAQLAQLGILWAAGPAAAVAALPASGGTLPSGSGIAYVWQPSAIQSSFNLVGAVRAA